MVDISMTGDVLIGVILSTLICVIIFLCLAFFLLCGYLTYQIILWLKEKYQFRNKVKPVKSNRKILSAWPDILALIQDGYISHAESLVKYNEDTIDNLRAQLQDAQIEISKLKNQ